MLRVIRREASDHPIGAARARSSSSSNSDAGL